MIVEKIEKFLEEEEYDERDELIEKMLDFMFSLSNEQLSDEQAYYISEIVDYFDPDETEQLDEDDESLDEAFKKRQRRDLNVARQRRRTYRRKRAQMRLKARRYRRSALGKKTIRKAKRFGRFGRTSKMKRQRKFIGPKLSKMR